ncbi:MAG: Lacal_2735 family protein [Bacteriovoracaceae bacterium]|nr:Lacal_2735 family protein [Bacteriovoracaceae bacterium]
MFNFLKKDPKKKLEEEYAKLLTQAVDAQRNGKIELYAQLTVQSEEILKKIEVLEAQK